MQLLIIFISVIPCTLVYPNEVLTWQMHKDPYLLEFNLDIHIYMDVVSQLNCNRLATLLASNSSFKPAIISFFL